METSRKYGYAPPVDQLLTYGENRGYGPDQWPDYLALGIGPEQIPDLIRMATDEKLEWADEDSLEVWAPIHAWRTLGQLRAEAAIEPLFSLFTGLYESDWVTEELPEVFGMIGPAALPILKAAIADIATDEEICIDAISCVQKIGARWPEARSACVALLMDQLELFTVNDPEVNGFLVLELVDLKAIEAAPLIERAFAARCVDRMVMGDWEDVQVEFGLKSAEEVKHRQRQRYPETPLSSATHEVTPPKTKHEHEAGQKKAKSQMVKQSRKKNRKQ
jgi:hypothetical protein